jgi:hypothetical protein
MKDYPLVQDAGKLLLCRAVDQQTGEGGKEDGWKLNVNCKFAMLLTPRI